MDTINPVTEEVITKVQRGCKEDIDLAVKAARKAFDNGIWRKTDDYERSRIMNRFADIVEANNDELAKIEALDNGKPAKIAASADMPLVVRTFRYFAGLCQSQKGRVVSYKGPYQAYTRQEPVGVVGAITPWNFSALMPIWKLAPIIASGCTVILKPSEKTPLMPLKIAEMLK